MSDWNNVNWIALTLLLLSACAPTMTFVERSPLPSCEEPRPLDILFVIQGSELGPETAASWVANIEELAAALSSGDPSGAGEPPFQASIPSVHAAIISADIGYPEASGLVGCTDSGDGARMTPMETRACEPATAEAILDLTNTPSVSGEAIRCRAGRRTDCPPQPLEAMLWALTPSSSPLRFDGDRLGLGDGPNAGFLRDDSVLVVILIGPRDDCSFAPGVPRDALARCTGVAGADSICCDDNLLPIDRYVEGLGALRSDGLARVMLFAVTGVPIPIDANDTEWGFDYDAALRRIAEHDRTQPLCATASYASLVSPRIVELAAHLAPRALVRSTCESSSFIAYDYDVLLRAACVP